jgi:hypothetical protein
MGRMDINEREECESHCVECDDCIADTSLSVVDVNGEWICEECKTALDEGIAALLTVQGDMLDRGEMAKAAALQDVINFLTPTVRKSE